MKTSKLRVTGLCENSPHKGPVTLKMSPFDDVIMRGSYVYPNGRSSPYQSGLFYWNFNPNVDK